MPYKVKPKRFLERIIPLKAVPRNLLYDISEVVDDSGEEEFKKTLSRARRYKKTAYRLLHHNDPIPNVKLNIKNRYKQLTKAIIRLFQNTESCDDIIKSLSNYVVEKSKEKINSPHSVLLYLTIDLVSGYGSTLYNNTIWSEIKRKYPAGEIENKPHSWYIEEYGIISKTKITNISETKFGAKYHSNPDQEV